MVKKLTRVAAGSAVALSLVGGSLLASPSASAQCVDPVTGEPAVAVMISGGTITNETVIDISANAGTSVSDASGGSNNLATTGGGADGIDTASSGNGGVATSAANGGAVSIGHPIGMTGIRLIMTALFELRRRGGKYAVCTPCIGGGEATAVLIEAL